MSPEIHGGQFSTRSKMMPIKIQLKKLNHIMELSLYNQRDMLIEIDNLKSEIIAQKRPQLKKTIEKQKKREVRFSGNPILEKVNYYLYKLRS